MDEKEVEADVEGACHLDDDLHRRSDLVVLVSADLPSVDLGVECEIVL